MSLDHNTLDVHINRLRNSNYGFAKEAADAMEAAKKEIANLGSLLAVGEAFHKTTVLQRNAAWRENETVNRQNALLLGACESVVVHGGPLADEVAKILEQVENGKV